MRLGFHDKKCGIFLIVLSLSLSHKLLKNPIKFLFLKEDRLLTNLPFNIFFWVRIYHFDKMKEYSTKKGIIGLIYLISIFFFFEKCYRYKFFYKSFYKLLIR